MKRALTVSVAEASTLSGLSGYGIRKAIAAGDLPRFGRGRVIRIPLLPLLRMLGVEDIDAATHNGAAPHLERDQPGSRQHE